MNDISGVRGSPEPPPSSRAEVGEVSKALGIIAEIHAPLPVEANLGQADHMPSAVKLDVDQAALKHLKEVNHE